MTSEQQSGELYEAYFIGTLIAITAIAFSFGAAVLINVGADPLVGQALGAAWAWAVGVWSAKWWFPWVKQGVPTVESGETDA